jgi:hypothetical protein
LEPNLEAGFAIRRMPGAPQRSWLVRNSHVRVRERCRGWGVVAHSVPCEGVVTAGIAENLDLPLASERSLDASLSVFRYKLILFIEMP